MAPTASLAPTTALASSPAIAPTPALVRTPPSRADHGRLDWFQGTFEKALEKAKSENKIVFIDFWASWCAWCKRFDLEALSDPAVMAETRDLVCMNLDAESAAGVPLAARFGADGLPSLVFVEPDGSLRERLSGFRPAQQFVQEIRRIRANEDTLGSIEKRIAANPDDLLARLDLVMRLRRMHDAKWEREMQSARDRIERGTGFDPKSPDDRFAIGRKLRLCGDEKGYQEQLAAIRALDPDGRSVPMRRLALNTLIENVNERYRKEHVFDTGPVQLFLAEQESPTVLFDGYSILHGMAIFQADDAQRRGQPEIAADNRKQARDFARRAWNNCPPDRRASFGREVAQNLLLDPQLDDTDRTFLLEVATQASEAAPRSADHLELLGRCLEKSGKPADALAAYRRAVEIDPSRNSAMRRITELAH